MPSPYSYPKDEHLKHRKLIELVFTRGNSKVFYPICFYWIGLECPINDYPILFGANASKKKFKRAVDRNRIKRQIREAYRTQKDLWILFNTLEKKQLAVMAIYVGKEIPKYKKIKKSVVKGIRFILQDAVSDA